MKAKKVRKFKESKIIFFVFLFLFLLLGARLTFLALTTQINNINIKEFAATRNTVTKTIKSVRGNIFDGSGNVLASNVSAYTVVAYINPKVTGNSSTPKHVTNVTEVATALAPILEMEVGVIEELINNAKENNAWQVELGPGGRDISELKKEQIESLGLNGIGFIENIKRYYPSGDFASYIIGYVRRYEEFEHNLPIYNLVGELGIEAKYNEELSGKDGSITYQQDLAGYKIPDTPETVIKATNGNDIYLTLDSSIQRFTESAVKEVQNIYNPEWLTLTVMDAKTGKILGTSSSPSFDPNVKDITSYENPLITTTYEPGSTMKMYTYMCAMEKGTYDGNKTYLSGTINIGSDTVKDWNKDGWGSITFDKGFEYSSNVGVSTMVQTMINKNDLRSCLEKYGFGSKTGVELSAEAKGRIDTFNYPIEVANASFGQGITITAIQALQGLTIIANDGNMLKPRIVEKIVDSSTQENIYSFTKEEEKVASTETVNKMKDLMHAVINGTDYGTTGTSYKIDGFDVIGKTGTAQIYDTTLKRYLSGENDYIYSFAGMYPKDNPEVIIYATMKKPTHGASYGLSEAVKKVAESTAKYLNIFDTNNNINVLEEVNIQNYIGKNINDVNLENLEVIKIGDGDIIINQEPKQNTLIAGEKIFFLTNGLNKTMPNMTNWSKREVSLFGKLVGLEFNFEGFGYVYEQSLEAGSILTNDIQLKLKDKFTEESVN